MCFKEKTILTEEEIKPKEYNWEPWIYTGINSWISIDDNDNEFLSENDIVELKTQLSKDYRDINKINIEKAIYKRNFEIAETIHKHILNIKNIEVLDLLEKIQKEIVSNR